MGNGPGHNHSGLGLGAVTTTVTGTSSQDDFYRVMGFNLGNTAPEDIPSSHESYVTWTVSPEDNYLVSLDSTGTIVWRDIRIYNADDDVPDNIVVRSSLDGYESNLMIHPAGGDGITVDVGSGFQNLSEPVTFRLYVCNEFEDTSGQMAMRPDSKGPDITSPPLGHLDLIVNGSAVQVPEPASLSTLAMCAAFLRRRTGLY